MEVVLSLLAILLLAVLLGYTLKGGHTLQKFRTDLATLADARCPKCKRPIGNAEADAASERSLALGKKYTTAQALPNETAFWPVICPACEGDLCFWLSTRQLFETSELIRQGWLRDYDVEV